RRREVEGLEARVVADVRSVRRRVSRDRERGRLMQSGNGSACFAQTKPTAPVAKMSKFGGEPARLPGGLCSWPVRAPEYRRRGSDDLSTRKEVKVAEHPNVTRVTRALEARARGKFDDEDTKIILAAFADDAVWHMSGAWSDVQGKDALLAQWKTVAEASDDSFRVELHEMFADDDHAVGISTIRAKNGEKSMEMKEIQVFHLDSDGKIT